VTSVRLKKYEYQCKLLFVYIHVNVMESMLSNGYRKYK
jgi:hypothetical protein